jgi:hypothetical protein
MHRITNSQPRHLLTTAFAALTLACSVHAIPILTPTSGLLGTSRWQGSQTSQSEIDAAIDPLLGTSFLQFKQDVLGGESGSLAGSYTATFSNSPSDPANALIHWDGGSILGDNRFLLVKDGNQDPAWYLYNLTLLGWNGTDDLVLNDFWPNQGAISHVSLYGDSGAINVPDGGTTAALLGLGLLSVGFANRMRLVKI